MCVICEFGAKFGEDNEGDVISIRVGALTRKDAIKHIRKAIAALEQQPEHFEGNFIAIIAPDGFGDVCYTHVTKDDLQEWSKIKDEHDIKQSKKEEDRIIG